MRLRRHNAITRYGNYPYIAVLRDAEGQRSFLIWARNLKAAKAGAAATAVDMKAEVLDVSRAWIGSRRGRVRRRLATAFSLFSKWQRVHSSSWHS